MWLTVSSEHKLIMFRFVLKCFTGVQCLELTLSFRLAAQFLFSPPAEISSDVVADPSERGFGSYSNVSQVV